MKLVNLLIASALILQATIGHAQDFDSPYTRELMGNTKPGQCVRAAMVGMEVLTSDGDGIYQIGARYGGTLVMQGFLQTVQSKFAGPGLIRTGMLVSYVGVKEFPLENGFMGKFGMWKECK